MTDEAAGNAPVGDEFTANAPVAKVEITPPQQQPAQVTTNAPASKETIAPPQQEPAQVTADDIAQALSRATRLGAEYGMIPATVFRHFLPDNQQW